jgi:predicted lysophospholipase L1 biosynthesis ABC-type transport system permease subunit
MSTFKLIICILLALVCAKGAMFLMQAVFALAFMAAVGIIKFVIFCAIFVAFFGIFASWLYLQERGKKNND